MTNRAEQADVRSPKLGGRGRERDHLSNLRTIRRRFVRITTRMLTRWGALGLCGLCACATVSADPPPDRTAPQAAMALGRLLQPLASDAAYDLVESEAWPGAQLREDGGVVQVDFGRTAELRCGFRGRFTLTRQNDGSWLVSIDELSDGKLRYWGTAEVQPDAGGLVLRLDLVVLDGTRGAELIVSGRIRRVAGRWRLEAEGVWNDGVHKLPVRVAQGLSERPRIAAPPTDGPVSDSSLL